MINRRMHPDPTVTLTLRAALSSDLYLSTAEDIIHPHEFVICCCKTKSFSGTSSIEIVIITFVSCIILPRNSEWKLLLLLHTSWIAHVFEFGVD